MHAVKFDPNNTAELTDYFITGSIAQGWIEDALSDYLTPRNIADWRIGCDPYDWSIEVHICGTTPEQTPVTEELVKLMADMGCHRWWMNYHHTDESGCVGKRFADVSIYKGHIGPVRTKNY